MKITNSVLPLPLSLFVHTINALNITIYQPNIPFAPSPLPPSHAESDGEQIISLFQTLGRTTVWKSVANITFQGDTYEPEGMIRLGVDRYIVRILMEERVTLRVGPRSPEHSLLFSETC
jgi:hypothetical protein